jgi:hypothetical protein
MRLSRADREELGVVEPFWQAQLAVLFALLLYVALPGRLTLGPGWLLPLFEGVLLVDLLSRLLTATTLNPRLAVASRSV